MRSDRFDFGQHQIDDGTLYQMYGIENINIRNERHTTFHQRLITGNLVLKVRNWNDRKQRHDTRSAEIKQISDGQKRSVPFNVY